MIALCLALSPGQAHATFKDSTTSYPASQDLGTYGEPITGDQLPDGAYRVTARTSSRMCIMYTDPENAEARDSKEQAIILVNGGNITAVFYLSKAYNYIYLGPQEDAVAATNEDGTDASAYIAGDPAEGYVPHLYYLNVPALNTPMSISTFSGGDRGIEGGMWYTREAVFGMTEAEFQAAVNGTEEPVNDADNEDEAVVEEPVAENETPENEVVAAPVVATISDDSASGDDNDNGSVSPEEPEQAPEPVTVESTGVRGVRLMPANAAMALDVAVPVEQPAPEPEAVGTFGMRHVPALAFVGAVTLGVLARCLLFRRGFVKPQM